MKEKREGGKERENRKKNAIAIRTNTGLFTIQFQSVWFVRFLKNKWLAPIA